jgi:hypothetical protein
MSELTEDDLDALLDSTAGDIEWHMGLKADQAAAMLDSAELASKIAAFREATKLRAALKKEKVKGAASKEKVESKKQKVKGAASKQDKAESKKSPAKTMIDGKAAARS